MATITPFRPIRLNLSEPGSLVFIRPQAESVTGASGLTPLKALLEAGARVKPETPEGQIRAYMEIRLSLASMLDKGQLWRETTPAIYVYEVSHKSYQQTGIWAQASLNDYREGRIKIHELTLDDSTRRIRNYRQHTGLEGSPVLLAHTPDNAISRIIKTTKKHKPEVSYKDMSSVHRIWKINDPGILDQLAGSFSGIATVYLADGHHRLESAGLLAEEQRRNGLPVYDTISALYMPLDELRIERFDRVVIPEKEIDELALFWQLIRHFHLRESTGNLPVAPKKVHRMGMYLNGKWYHLLCKKHTYEQMEQSRTLDAAILQERVLAPFFDIQDPKTDSRLKCTGGEKAQDEIDAILCSHPHAIVFTLCPVTIDQLISVADAGGVLPPKSTWIVPKIPYGLLIQQHE